MKSKKRRIGIIPISFILTVIIFAIIIVKLLYVAISPTVDGMDLNKFALSRTTTSKKIEASRGTIYDYNGEILAQNVTSYTVIAYLDESRTKDADNPRHVVDKEKTAQMLSEVLNADKNVLFKLLNQKGLYQTELGIAGRNITELVKEKIESLDLPGIDFIKSSKRDYPNGDFASYIIGYAKKNEEDNIVGELGIEGKYNEELTGTNGKITYQKDAYGYKIANTPEVKEDATDGYNIYLTIDSNIQMFLENAINELEGYGIDWATLTLADAKTGAIVGSASSPSFNPNTLNITNYNNPLTSYVYEPGSTMKIYSFMAAIEEGLYDGNKTYKSGSIKVDDYVISDWNEKGWGTISYDTGFTYSSNVAAVNLSKKLGKTKLMDYYEAFGFGKVTGIEMPNEYNGKLDFIYGSEIASASYGQGITTTPIQNIQALTSLTNKGTILKPYIVDKITDNDGNIVYEGKKVELNKVVKEETVNKIIDLMDQTVNSSDNAVTGKKYHTDAVTLIGKTGTANYTVNGVYASGTYNTIRSFAGIFPKEDPRYIIYVSVKRFRSAANNMGTVIKKMVESVAKYKNLSEQESKEDLSKIINLKNYINNNIEKTMNSLNALNLKTILIGDGNVVVNQYPLKDMTVLSGSKVFLLTNGSNIIMPDIAGWSRSEVITFANLAGISYTINGYGNVSSFNANPGDIISKDQNLIINLGG